MDLRGTIRTFRFLSLLSARWPAAQSPIVNRGVWLQISWKKEKERYLKKDRQNFEEKSIFSLKQATKPNKKLQQKKNNSSTRSFHIKMYFGGF